MDSSKFDLITRTISEIASRRSVVQKIVGGGAVTALAGLRALQDAEAKKKKKKNNKKKCKASKCPTPTNPCQEAVCKKDKCKTQVRPDGTSCGNGEICIGGECLAECAPGSTCDPGLSCCSAVCADTDTSFENCGGCGEPCEEAVADNCSAGECQCGNSAQCTDDLICESGECVCPAGEKLCDGACIPEDDVCFVAVTSANLQGWILAGEDPFSDNPALTQIVDGPEDPPAPGEGSVKLNPTAFNGFNEDQTQAVVRTLQYEGTAVGDIDRLQYSIYVPATAGDPPTMQLAVVGDPGSFNSEGFASLVFIPGANGNLAPDEDDWTNYTPSDAGVWVSTRDLLGPADECLMCRTIGNTHEGGCLDVATCNANKLKTWAQIQDAIPNAELNDSGSFSFRIGRGDTGEGNVTNIVFNDDGYFFED
jgi:hypothetical protein